MSRRGDPGGGNAFETHAEVERALVEERANVLGRAGDRLERAVERWQAVAADHDVSEHERHEALDEVSAAVYALVVQRECVGFRFDNLGWIRRHYPIPDAALRRLGATASDRRTAR